MKMACAWCKKGIRECSEKAVSHGICEVCAKRMTEDMEHGHRREEFSGWFSFIEGQLLLAFVCFALIFLVVLTSEGLHYLTGGKVPQLIEWQPKHVPPQHAQKKFHR